MKIIRKTRNIPWPLDLIQTEWRHIGETYHMGDMYRMGDQEGTT